MLAKTAAEDKTKSAGSVTDQALLAAIAVENKDSDVREAAVEKLTDQALLAKIATEEKDAVVRFMAKHRLGVLQNAK